MYFVSGSLVAAVNVLLVVALVVVALLVMPLIHDCAVRLITRLLRGAAGSDARSDAPKTEIIAPKTEDETLKARRGGATNQSRANRKEFPPAGYFKSVREICTRHNVILILDEIQTGLGRTGRLLMYFVSGSLVAAVNVLLVVALVVVALLVMPLIHDCAVRLITRRLRGAAGSDARSDAPKTEIIAPKTEDETLKARRGGATNQSRANRKEFPPAGYFKSVREICTRHNVILILDEIQTGLGRTGRLLAEEHEGIEADLTLIGKALSGGFYPVSAVLSNDEILGVLKPGEHGSTFGGNPLACAVARAALKVLIEEGMVENAHAMGARFLAGLRQINSPAVKEVRGRGLMIAIELLPQAGGARRYCDALRLRGVLCKDTHDHTIRVSPALAITGDEIDWALDQFDAALRHPEAA